MPIALYFESAAAFLAAAFAATDDAADAAAALAAFVANTLPAPTPLAI